MIGRRVLAFVCVAFLAASAWGAPKASRVQGRVEIRLPRTTEWRAVEAGMDIPDGSRIQTAIGARLEVALGDGSTTTLRENSIFEVVRTTNNRNEFRLWIGSMRNRVRPLQAGATYQVRTPIATAGVRGTDFEMGVGEDGTTGLQTYEGSVWFRSDISDLEVIVPAGQVSTASPGGEVSAPAAAEGGPSSEDDAFSADDGSAAPAADVAITIESPREGDIVGAGSVAVVGAAAPGVRLRVAGQDVVCDATGRFAASAAVVDGPNVLLVETEDGAARAQVTVVVDATVPAVTLDVENGRVTNQPSLPLSVVTTPGASVTVAGQTVEAPGGQASFTLSLTEGENLIAVEVTGANGKKAVSTLYVVLDTIAPTLTVSVVSNVAGGVHLTGFTEAGASVTANGFPLEIRADGSFDDVLSGVQAPLTLEAIDRAGNVTRDVRTVEGSIDGAAPTLVSLTYGPSTVEAGASASATLQVSDASDVAPTVDLVLSGPGGASLTATLVASGTTYTGTIDVPQSATSGVYTTGSFAVSDVLNNATTLSPGTTLTVANNAPDAPGNVAVSDPGSGGRLEVSWPAVSASDLSYYTIRQSPGGGEISVGTATSYAFDNLTDGTPYTYEVVAVDEAGNRSNPATSSSVAPSDRNPPDPVAFTSVTSSGAGPYQVDLAWNTSNDAAGGVVTYEVKMGTSSSEGGAFQIYSGTSPSTQKTGLSTGTYWFFVRALDDNVAAPTGGPNATAWASQSIAVP